MDFGICRLTKNHGKFVKAHILPKALTRPEAPGLPFEQGGNGTRPITRWSSWYDPHLVTEEGERILTDLDTWAIAELRRNRLVWSGWGTAKGLEANHQILDDTNGWGIRTVPVSEPHKLRLFFLSLLWRAVASDLAEFQDVTIPEEDMETLRLKLLSGDAEPIWFYQIQLIQLSTRGIIHNHTPIKTAKATPSSDVTATHDETIYRFYLDGLVIHFNPSPIHKSELGDIVVGNSKTLVVTTVPFEGSTQFFMLMSAMADASRYDSR